MKKILAVDVETTGLDPATHEIIQLAALIVIDDKTVSSFCRTMRPLSKAIDDKALEIHGYTREQIYSFVHPVIVYGDFIHWLGKYINKYDKEDKAFFLAFNATFDLRFIEKLARIAKDNFLFSFFSPNKILDPLMLARYMQYREIFSFESCKLEYLCNYFKIPLKAHDALSDIEGAVQLFYTFDKILLSR